MSFTTANNTAATRAAIEGRIKRLWTYTEIKFPGIDFTPPEGKAWIEIFILRGRVSQTLFAEGAGAAKAVGVLQITIYSPRGKGTGELDNLTDKARQMFSMFSGLGFDFEAMDYGPRDAREGWLTQVLSCSFQTWEKTELFQ